MLCIVPERFLTASIKRAGVKGFSRAEQRRRTSSWTTWARRAPDMRITLAVGSKAVAPIGVYDRVEPMTPKNGRTDPLDDSFVNNQDHVDGIAGFLFSTEVAG